jgi:hypothetical protein
MRTILLILLLVASITKQSHAQIITTIAGTGIAGFSGDIGQATAAELHNPNGISLDATGAIFTLQIIEITEYA